MTNRKHRGISHIQTDWPPSFLHQGLLKNIKSDLVPALKDSVVSAHACYQVSTHDTTLALWSTGDTCSIAWFDHQTQHTQRLWQPMWAVLVTSSLTTMSLWPALHGNTSYLTGTNASEQAWHSLTMAVGDIIFNSSRTDTIPQEFFLQFTSPDW